MVVGMLPVSEEQKVVRSDGGSVDVTRDGSPGVLQWMDGHMSIKVGIVPM